LATRIVAGEPEVLNAQRAVLLNDGAEVACNATVVANLTARMTEKVITEVAHARVELLEDDGLGFDLANLLGNDPLSHLLNDEETLLDDLNGLTVANNF